MIALIRLFACFLFCILARAAPLPCSYACPSTDEIGHVLVLARNATPYTSPYSIFDCVYADPKASIDPHTCSYYKSDGLYAIGSRGSSCPKQAISCSGTDTPLFSAEDHVEPFPWVDNGKYLLWLHENPVSG